MTAIHMKSEVGGIMFHNRGAATASARVFEYHSSNKQCSLVGGTQTVSGIDIGYQMQRLETQIRTPDDAKVQTRLIRIGQMSIIG